MAQNGREMEKLWGGGSKKMPYLKCKYLQDLVERISLISVHWFLSNTFFSQNIWIKTRVANGRAPIRELENSYLGNQWTDFLELWLV